MLDLNKEYGIVLEGGGAKGAYQIGVWKALKESGVKIKGIAGVSVGALNGALICMDDIALAEEIWTNIKYSQIMDVDDVEMHHLMKRELTKLNLGKITKTSAKAVTSGGIDNTPLRNLIESHVDEKKVKESGIDFVMGTLNLSELKGMEIEARSLEDGELKEYLVASASLPVFKSEKYQGKTYLDGGMVNNVPVDMLINRGYDEIIVIRIYGIGVEKKVTIPEGVHVQEISPRVDLGSILEFDSKKTRRNIKIGYYDGMRLIHDLKGKIYYLSEVQSEREHINRFLAMSTECKRAWLEYMKEDSSEEESYDRKILSMALPMAAEKLTLSKNWTYTELYLSMLELAAKELKVLKYRIYSEEDFCQTIVQCREEAAFWQPNDQFVSLVLTTICSTN